MGFQFDVQVMFLEYPAGRFFEEAWLVPGRDGILKEKKHTQENGYAEIFVYGEEYIFGGNEGW